MKMKKKNEDEKNELFFCRTKKFHIQYAETSNLDSFKYVTISLISLLDRKIQLVKASQKQPKMGILSLL